MERSPYLTQALQSMGQSAPMPAQTGMDPTALAGAIKKRKEWQTANPGQSYMKHSLGQIGQGLRAAPGNIMGAPKRLAEGVGGIFKGL